MVLVIVRSLSGKSLEHIMCSEAQVQDLMDVVAAIWEVPPLFQQMLHNGVSLNPSVQLHTVCEDPGASLELALVVSLRKAFDHERVETRLDALQCLMPYSDMIDQHDAVSLIEDLLGDPSPPVRYAALKALPHLAQKGDPHVIDLLTRPWKTANSKRAALEGLGQVSKKGDQRALACVAAHLVDVDWQVRVAALRTLSEIAKQGDQNAIHLVAPSLINGRSQVRCAALEVIMKIAERGGSGAVALVVAQLNDLPADEKCLALEVLAQISERGDEVAIASVVTQLDKGTAILRRAALEALLRIADMRDPYIIAVVAARIKEHGSAVEALLQLPESSRLARFAWHVHHNACQERTKRVFGNDRRLRRSQAPKRNQKPRCARYNTHDGYWDCA